MLFPRCRPHVNPLAITKEVSFDGFENNNPLVVDIGSYKGEFVKALADKHPEKNYIACEIRTPIANALRTMFKDYQNVVVFDGDAGLNFQKLLEPSLEKGIKLERVYVNFPDPWFKESHKKRRFINHNFLKSIHSWFPSEAEIVFQTDQEFLFEETQEYLIDSGFEVIEVFHNPPFGVQTNWEKAKSECGKTIFRCIIKKKK